MTDVRVAVRQAQATKNDGAQNISKEEYAQIKAAYVSGGQSDDSLKWLAKEQPSLHAALSSDLDYSGFVGASNHTLDVNRAGGEMSADAQRRAQSLDKLPSLHGGFKENGMPLGTPGGDAVSGGGFAYKTGSNTTVVRNGNLDVSDADAQKSRDKQTELTTKMSSRIGLDVTNPPTPAAGKAYFQQLAKDGMAPAEIQKEYKNYLDTFYKHPGGVEWSPPITAQNVNERFADQPVGRDGKKLIDCEGYAALTENVLGDLKSPTGDKMFDVKQASNGAHVFTGVFPHGKGTGGFAVSNSSIEPLPLDPRLAQGSVSRQREIALNGWNDAKMKAGNNEAHASTIVGFGDSYADIKPLSEKYKKL